MQYNQGAPASQTGPSPSGSSPSVSPVPASVPCAVLEHYSDVPVRSVEMRPQGQCGEKDWHWRGKPNGFWVSVAGEDDWPSWCRAEEFGIERLGIRHTVELAPTANILWVRGVAEIDAFDVKYGRSFRLSERSDYSKHLIDWPAVAAEYDGIIIAPYVWERRLDGRVSDWYYGWDCASGVIWNAEAIAAIAIEASGQDALAA